MYINPFIKERVRNKLLKNTLNWLLSFLQHGDFRRLLPALPDFFTFRKAKGLPLLNPHLCCQNTCMVTCPAQGPKVPLLFHGAKCWRRLTWTDSQNHGVVYVGKDFWKSPSLISAQSILQVKSRLPKTLNTRYWKAWGMCVHWGFFGTVHLQRNLF